MNPSVGDYLPDASETVPATIEPNEHLRRIAEALQLEGEARNKAVSTIVLEVLKKRGQFYHIEGAPDFGTSLYFDHQTKVLITVKSDHFKQMVSDAFVLNRASNVWRWTDKALENASIGEGSIAIEPEAYWASRPGSTYLSNGPGQLVRITAKRAELVDNGTDGVLFPMGCTLKPWKVVQGADPFETCTLFRNLNATANHGAVLAKLWAISLPTNPKNKPPLVLAGTIGSGKTRYALGLAELYGLPIDGRTIKIEEYGERDFWPILEAGGLAIVDNADTHAKWLADALASASTGIGQTKRKLYADSDLVKMRARSWIMITTARPDAFAGDPGLADRLLVVRMDRRTGETRDGELSQEILRHRDAGLSWICERLSEALEDTCEPPVNINKRHPDFAALAVKIGRAIGKEPEAIKALTAAENDKSLFCLESDSLGSALLAQIRAQGEFKGVASVLLQSMREHGHIDPESRLTAKGLGKRLEGLWPHIESVLGGHREKDRSGTWCYRIGHKKSTHPPTGEMAP